jgi:hypothetical protein
MQPVAINYANPRRADPLVRRRWNRILLLLVGAAVAITVVLAGTSARESSQRNQTKVTLRALVVILDRYRTATGSVPPDVDLLFSAGTTLPTVSPVIGAMPPSAVTRSPGGLYIVLDGFGNPVVLVIVASDPRSPYFQSAGPDGVLGTADDMFSYGI